MLNQAKALLSGKILHKVGYNIFIDEQVPESTVDVQPEFLPKPSVASVANENM